MDTQTPITLLEDLPGMSLKAGAKIRIEELTAQQLIKEKRAELTKPEKSAKATPKNG